MKLPSHLCQICDKPRGHGDHAACHRTIDARMKGKGRKDPNKRRRAYGGRNLEYLLKNVGE